MFDVFIGDLSNCWMLDWKWKVKTEWCFGWCESKMIYSKRKWFSLNVISFEWQWFFRVFMKKMKLRWHEKEKETIAGAWTRSSGTRIHCVNQLHHNGHFNSISFVSSSVWFNFSIQFKFSFFGDKFQEKRMKGFVFLFS